jgi:rod shape-determining protein MreD
MKESLLFLPLTVIYLAIKSTLFPAFPAPDLPLIIVFYMAYRKSSFEAVLLGFALGYIEDAFSAGIIGSTSFALIAVFIAVNLFSRKVQFSTPMMRGGGIAVASAVKGLIIYAIIRASHAKPAFLQPSYSGSSHRGDLARDNTLPFKARRVGEPAEFKDNEN